jgi:outer membrane lipoprotein-sorting protein
VFDRDLNQVIVRKLDVALGSTPAALLAGDSALEKNFDLTTRAGVTGSHGSKRSRARPTRDSSA